MEDQNQPIQESEYILRRIHRNHFTENLPLPIQTVAFRPNQNDTTGLSVFRERFVQPAETLTNIADDKKDHYVIARLNVSDLQALGLSVAPEPDPNGPAGHAVIPELSWDNYNSNKKRSKEIQLELAKLASKAIVHRPD